MFDYKKLSRLNPAMKQGEPNNDAQKNAIHGLLGCHILVEDGLDLALPIPCPNFVVFLIYICDCLTNSISTSHFFVVFRVFYEFVVF